VVDYHYISNPTTTTAGSLLTDPTQIIYDPTV
jgi:hypothetical protein